MELADYLKRYPEKHATIIGHTDNKEDYNSNYRLGTIRANNLKEYFESKGIAPERLKSSSQGEQSPVSTNDTEEGRALNRRIEVKIK